MNVNVWDVNEHAPAAHPQRAAVDDGLLADPDIPLEKLATA